jgi:hypothetical protein
MSLSRKVAQALCTSQELNLFDESTPAGIKSLSIKQIESKIKVARKYKDKYTTLHRTQIRNAQSDKGRAAGNQVAFNTAKKIKIFDDCIQRFEATRKKRIEDANKPKKTLGRPPGSLNKKTLALKGSASKKSVAKGKPAKKKSKK